ncbi:Gfo/Idh/MocA family oxidoreductase [[Clostridium] symbiosum]|uniref:Gfo/Idh/MocA family protein n=1 Tax=Clostridium symbiosum TaxID=1512 RepID=UPI001D075411|nr:Gfo/Idh/MocA family oxidoreductase [[Clostridium] symbiosum]MCB6609486.1 Gfo/Idh/MocA family oxidoreductase [[Clostridium] symbiosum]MCB6929521.1 Gfo/Idh/MocA family oxidoreductase [[Clostridium] symbiosum]
MEKKFRVGVIGTGAIARIAHLPVLTAREDVELAGVMAKHPENARKAKERYAAGRAVETMEEMIGLGLDCAFVLSPKTEHPLQVKMLLNAGIDVFCEKPLAMTLREADEMADLSVKTGRKLMVGFNRRFAPVYRKAKEAYGELVPDVIVAQKNRPASEYRATLENAIHMVDLMRYLSGECVKVDACAKFTDPYYETLVTAQLQFENGTVGLLAADRSSGQWVETMEIHGHNRSVYVNSPDSVTVVDGEQSHTTQMTPLAMGWARVEDKLGFEPAVAHFFDCLKTGKEPLTNAQDAYKTHELMHRILKAAGLPALD